MLKYVAAAGKGTGTCFVILGFPQLFPLPIIGVGIGEFMKEVKIFSSENSETSPDEMLREVLNIVTASMKFFSLATLQWELHRAGKRVTDSQPVTSFPRKNKSPNEPLKGRIS